MIFHDGMPCELKIAGHSPVCGLFRIDMRQNAAYNVGKTIVYLANNCLLKGAAYVSVRERTKHT